MKLQKVNRYGRIETSAKSGLIYDRELFAAKADITLNAQVASIGQEQPRTRDGSQVVAQTLLNPKRNSEGLPIRVCTSPVETNNVANVDCWRSSRDVRYIGFISLKAPHRR